MAHECAPAASWVPDQAGLATMVQIFHDSQIGDNDVQRRVYEQLEELAKHPEFNNYLVYVLCHMKDQPEAIRHKAGLKLKTNIKQNYHNTHPHVRDYVKVQVLALLGDPSKYIRRTVGTAITTIAVHDGLQNWPGLLEGLCGLLDDPDPCKVDGAFNALAKICEDMPEQLDSEALGRPLNVLIPKFISFFASPQEDLRVHALQAVNHFLIHMPQALVVNMPSYMQAISVLCSDPSMEIKKRVCQAFVMLLEIRVEHLTPHMDQVIQFILACSTCGDEVVALEACEFWAAYCECDPSDASDAGAGGVDFAVLRPYLPQVVPMLMGHMVYSDFELCVIAGEADEDDHVVDDEQNTLPAHHHAQGGSGGAGEDGHGDDDDDAFDGDGESIWTLRKCCAASLDSLSTVYHAEILPFLLPALDTALSNDNAAQWPIKEAGILAFGAVAAGCMEGLQPHLPELLAYMLVLLKHTQPHVRVMACWAISRYASWIVTQPDEQTYFRGVMVALVHRVLDRNKKVQTAACSAMLAFQEAAGMRLVPYVEPLLQNLMVAFTRYQAKNIPLLYDCIGVLADSVGATLNTPAFIQLLMPPLIARWNNTADNDAAIFPLLECLTSIARAIGHGFAPYAQGVFNRCCTIIRVDLTLHNHYAQAQAAANQAPAGPAAVAAMAEFENMEPPPEKEFIVSALDMLSGLVEGLEESCESLVGNCDLLQVLYQCLDDEDTDVRQSGFALLGDLVRTCGAHLRPQLGMYVQMCVRHMRPVHPAICNNSSWCVGQMAMRLTTDMTPFCPVLLDSLVPIITAHGSVKPSLLENAAITIGRLALVCPNEVAPRLEEFVQLWCVYLASIRNATEKEHAFRGLCAAIQKNPRGVLTHFSSLCMCLMSWDVFAPDTVASTDAQAAELAASASMHQLFQSMLLSFKNLLGPQWPMAMSQCAPELAQGITQRYGL